MSALPLADAATYLNLGSNQHDVELQTFIDAAEAVLAKHCGPLSSTATTCRVSGGPVLRLPTHGSGAGTRGDLGP